MTDPREITTTLELTQRAQAHLEARELDLAIEVVSIVEEKFMDDPIALHLAGVVWERAFLEFNAMGKSPSLVYYEKAAQYFERALKLDPEKFPFHAERLYTCLFVLGTQKNDLNRLKQSQALAEKLSDSADELLAANYQHELAIIKSGIARITQEIPDWEAADEAFEKLDCPDSGREKYFFCYYKGIVKRSLAEFHQDQQFLLEAIAAFRVALAELRLRSVMFLLADCLLQLEQPDAIDLSEMQEYIPELIQKSPEDPVIQTLFQRWEVRLKLLGLNPKPLTDVTDNSLPPTPEDEQS
ncbi:MAG: tetratricopeptide repeat protein [Sumerlaeia bacterium]